MRRFKNMANLIRSKRLKKNKQQREVAVDLGYLRCSQMISNVERQLCTIPPAKAKKVCASLEIEKEEFISAYLADEVDMLETAFKIEDGIK